MIGRITDKESNQLSDRAYAVESGKITVDKKLTKTNFEVIDTENSLTGMQAMAVVRLDNAGNRDYSHIAIAYAGTNSKDWRDLASDVVTVVAGVNVASQAEDAKKFAEKIKTSYPNAELSVHGHSLGGYNALYVGAELQLSTTTWNAPNPNNILSEKAEQWLRENPGKVVNFKEKNDLISYGGSVTGDEHVEGIYEPYNVYIDQGNEEQDIIRKVGGEPHQLSGWEKHMSAEGYLVDEYGTPYRYTLENRKEKLPLGEPAGLAKMLYANQTGNRIGQSFGTIIGAKVGSNLGATAGALVGMAVAGPIGATILGGVGGFFGGLVGGFLGNVVGGLAGAWIENTFFSSTNAYMAQYSSASTGRVRDFSQQVKEELLGLVQEVAEENILDITKWDIFYRCERLLGKSDHFQLNAQTLRDYYRKSIDIDGTTRQQIHDIFERVYQLDREYGSYLQSVSERVNHITTRLNVLADNIRV